MKQYLFLFNRATRRKVQSGKLKATEEGPFVVLRDKHGAFHSRRFTGKNLNTTPGFTKSDAPPDTSTQ